MRYTFLVILLSIFNSSSAQFPDTGICKKQPFVTISATIDDLSYDSMVYVNKDFIRKGFRLVLSDKSYQIVGFRVYFFGKYMDLYWKDITGETVNEVNLPILKYLHGDEWMEIECISITKKNSSYKALPFKIWINP